MLRAAENKTWALNNALFAIKTATIEKVGKINALWGSAFGWSWGFEWIGSWSFGA